MNTMTVLLRGHDEKAAVSGILRHFFRDACALEEDRFVVSYDARALSESRGAENGAPAAPDAGGMPEDDETPDAVTAPSVGAPLSDEHFRITSSVTPAISLERARRAARSGESYGCSVLVETVLSMPLSSDGNAGEGFGGRCASTASEEAFEGSSSFGKIASTQSKAPCEWVTLRKMSVEVPLHLMRRELRRQLFEILSEETGFRFPWGMLTGVRPTQIALNEIQAAREAGLPEMECAEARLINYWKTSPEKARLAVETALAEEEVLSAYDASRGDYIVYVGIPFCPGRCAYCSFVSQDAERQKQYIGAYVEAVISEAEALFSGCEKCASAVYFGGGTPTSLPAPLFRRYLDGVMSVIPMDSATERTLEAGRPDTFDEEKLAIIRDHGFQRICLNPQTMRDATLRRIGRKHTVDDVLRAFRLARSMGFHDINMDLIAGLPGDTEEDLLCSVNAVLALASESVTLHTLAIKKGSRLDRETGTLTLFRSDRLLSEAIEKAHAAMRRAGYAPYYLYRQKNCLGGLENTGFARPGYRSSYNVAMMSDQVPVIGLGSGSSSKALFEKTVKRFHNPKDLALYIDRIDDLIERKCRFFSKA